jgi:hypothetical protein
VTENLKPDKVKKMRIQILDTDLCHFVLFGSGKKKQAR